MSIVAFFPRLNLPVDWTNQEIAELYRVENSLVQAGIALETDRGLTDEGDPWFVFCRPDSGDVIVHFAKTDGLFLAASPLFKGVLRGSDFTAIVKQVLDTQPLIVPSRQSNKSQKLFMHPSAMLMAFVATAFMFSHETDPVVFSDGDSHKGYDVKDDPALSRIVNALRSFINEGKSIIHEAHNWVAGGNISTALLSGLFLFDRDDATTVNGANQSDALKSTVGDLEDQLINAVDESHSGNSILVSTVDNGPDFSLSEDSLGAFFHKVEETVLKQEVAFTTAIEGNGAPDYSVSSSVGNDSGLSSNAIIFAMSELEETVVINDIEVFNHSFDVINIDQTTNLRNAETQAREIISNIDFFSFEDVSVVVNSNGQFEQVFSGIDLETLVSESVSVSNDGAVSPEVTKPTDGVTSYTYLADQAVRAFVAIADDLQMVLYGDDLILYDGAYDVMTDGMRQVQSWAFDDGSTISIIGSQSELASIV